VKFGGADVVSSQFVGVLQAEAVESRPAKAGIDEMRRLAMQQGMRTLLQDDIEKAFKGVTDVKQARAIAVK
jgi:type II secretory ATPase GspE/PulE/Tfp pilus assembly ATPase PilB-like protein